MLINLPRAKTAKVSGSQGGRNYEDNGTLFDS